MSRIIKELGGPIIGGDEMPWSRAVVVEGKRMVYCSGETGRDLNKKQEYPELTENPNWTTEDQAALDSCSHDIEVQTQLVWDTIKQKLEELGTNCDNICKITYYLTERYNWPRAWKVTRKFWKEHAPKLMKRLGPHTLITKIGLDHPQMLIEIDVTACIPEPGDPDYKPGAVAGL
jgi:enamine deaminase RidA (YjgF/YER057c/UK114 family)